MLRVCLLIVAVNLSVGLVFWIWTGVASGFDAAFARTSHAVFFASTITGVQIGIIVLIWSFVRILAASLSRSGREDFKRSLRLKKPW
jgi:hypothetical protein